MFWKIKNISGRSKNAVIKKSPPFSIKRRTSQHSISYYSQYKFVRINIHTSAWWKVTTVTTVDPDWRSSLVMFSVIIIQLLMVQILHSDEEMFPDRGENHGDVPEDRRSPRRKRKRRAGWDEFHSTLTDKQFRRMFRMTRATFEKLCLHIKQEVDRDVFLPDADIHRYCQVTTS